MLTFYWLLLYIILLENFVDDIMRELHREEKSSQQNGLHGFDFVYSYYSYGIKKALAVLLWDSLVIQVVMEAKVYYACTFILQVEASCYPFNSVLV